MKDVSLGVRDARSRAGTTSIEDVVGSILGEIIYWTYVLQNEYFNCRGSKGPLDRKVVDETKSRLAVLWDLRRAELAKKYNGNGTGLETGKGPSGI